MANLLDVYRNSVQTWECDQMGHMNVQFYLDKAAAALEVLGHHLGLGPEYRQAKGPRLTACEHHVRFLREQHAGSPLTLAAGVLRADAQGLQVYLEMRDTASEAIAASFVVEAQLRDASGAHHTLPAQVLERAAALSAELPAQGGPRGLVPAPPRAAPRLAEADALGMLCTYTGAIAPAMCDSTGHMAVRHYMGIISDSIPNLVALTQGTSRAGSKVGGAALEYRLVYRRDVREGDLLTLRSAIKEIGSKAYQICHWLFDLASGEAVMTSEAVAVMFDLQARRAIVIPESARAGLEAHLIPGLSA